MVLAALSLAMVAMVARAATVATENPVRYLPMQRPATRAVLAVRAAMAVWAAMVARAARLPAPASTDGAVLAVLAAKVEKAPTVVLAQTGAMLYSCPAQGWAPMVARAATVAWAARAASGAQPVDPVPRQVLTA